MTIYSPQEKAVVELEQWLIGWQLKGSPSAMETAATELRSDAHAFQPPLNRIQQEIFRAYDAGRAISVMTIAAELADCLAFAGTGGAEYLQAMAFAAPAIVSAEDGQNQMMAAVQSWRHLQSPISKPGDVEIITAASITPTKIDWIWPGWLAAGKFHIIAGSPGTGKTTISIAIAAAITGGGVFPCGFQASQGSVLMWTGEDGWADSIIPRFIACGGHRSCLHIVKGVRGPNWETLPFDPAYDLDQLVGGARHIRDLKLLIIDPVVSAVSGDSHKNTETRRSLQPLVDFADGAGIAVLGITHYTKSTSGRDPIERVTGSLAFAAVPRLVMATGKSKEPGEPRRLVRAKSNIGPDGGGYEYDLAQVAVDEAKGIYGQRILWGEGLEGSAQSLLAEVEGPDDASKAPALEAAKVWLRNFLGTGVVAVKVLEEVAKQRGHHWATVKRAKRALGVEPVKLGLQEGWAWRMPKWAKDAEDAPQ